MTVDDDINTLTQAITMIDEVTLLRNNESSQKNEVLWEEETWSASDYKEELYSLLGRKYYEKIKISDV